MGGGLGVHGRACGATAASGLRQPILAPQALDAFELGEIAGHHGQPAASCVPGDEQIIAADGPSLTFQNGSDIGGVTGGGLVERQDGETCGETFDLATIVLRTIRLRRPVEQLRQHNGRDAQALGLEVEPLSHGLRPIPQDPDAKVRIEEIAEH